jgi:PKD repeat protein
MKRIYLISIALFFTNIVLAQTIVKKANSGIALDGHLEEELWNISNAISINVGGSDNTANFGLLWDEDYLYVGIEVTDNLLINGRRQAFYSDGVEICIDGNHDQSVNFDENDLQLTKPVKSYWVQEMNMNFEGIIHKYKETTNGYSMEFAIPWAIINTTPVSGHLAGFNIIVNDDDNAGSPWNLPSQLIWEGNSNYYLSPQNWGSIQLSSETVGFSGSYIALLSHNEGEFLINGKNTTIEWFSQNIDNVKIEYSADNGSQWTEITGSTNASPGLYEWTTNAPISEEFLIRVSDASNSSLSDETDFPGIVSESLASSELLIPSIWENYTWPYNAYFPEAEDGVNGHVGNACGHSSIARILHGWKFPRQGNGSLSFTDIGGFYWSADFGNTIYNYDNMPNYLPWEASEPEYTDVATLVYHAAVSMDDYWGSGTDLPNMSYAMSNYFNYKESDIAYMHNYTPAEWTQLLKNEIDNGRSMLVQGMNLECIGDWHTNNSIAGHWYHCDGYNEEGEFHIVVGFGNLQYDGYYSIEEFPLFGYNVGILTGLEPDLDGKTISLTEPNGGEEYIAGEEVEITWQSSGIVNLQIEYTLDNGQNWIEIQAATDASTGSCFWTTPENSSDQCKIRLTDTENINVYDQSDDVFDLMDLQLTLNYPAGGENFVFDNIALISWQTTPVVEIDIEYSADNGNSWNVIVSNFDASQTQYEWTVPQIETTQALIKISDSNDESNYYISNNTFSIVLQNLLGGPYISDDNTVLLMHFENNLKNQSTMSDDGITQGSGLNFVDNEIEGLGKCIEFDHSSGNPFISVPHNMNLSLDDDWTIETWFKATDFNNILQYFVVKPGDDDEYFSNYALQLNPYWSNVTFSYYFTEDTRIGLTGLIPELNEWYHMIFTRDTENGILRLIIHNSYLEELFDAQIVDTGDDPFNNIQDVLIGFNFIGILDELRISNVVRDYDNILQANFTANQINGEAPLEVVFNDLSTGNPTTWEWDFDNNGTIDSQVQNPVWTYSNPGTYSVKLTVSDGTSSNTKVKTNYIYIIGDSPGSHALLFDGTDDLASFDGFTYPTSDLTLEAWIRPTSFSDISEIMCGINLINNSTFQFRLQSNGTLLYGESPAWTCVWTDPCIELNQWQHVAVVKESGESYIYVNGELEVSGTVNEGVTPTQISIGGRAWNMDRFFAGDIDEVRIWSVARTPDEITDNMNSYLTGSESGLLGYWRINEGTGQITYDETANNHHFQLGTTSGIDSNDPLWNPTTWPYSVPSVYEVPDISIVEGETPCFNATETVIVAGDGKQFTVQDGGSAEIIAGINIVMKHGTTVEHGGTLHAYISDVFCNAPESFLASFEEQIQPEPELTPAWRETFFKVYPNPTTGDFTLEIMEFEASFALTVDIYTIQGHLILSRELPPEQRYTFSLAEKQPGIYIIRVMNNNILGTSRIIKQ